MSDFLVEFVGTLSRGRHTTAWKDHFQVSPYQLIAGTEEQKQVLT
jgi:hypothetical protein